MTDKLLMVTKFKNEDKYVATIVDSADVKATRFYWYYDAIHCIDSYQARETFSALVKNQGYKIWGEWKWIHSSSMPDGVGAYTASLEAL